MANPKIAVEITANSEQLRSEMNRAVSSISAATGQMSTKFGDITRSLGSLQSGLVGIASVFAAGSFFKSAITDTVDFTVEVDKLSRVMGINKQEATTLSVAIGDIFEDTDMYVSATAKLVKQINTSSSSFAALGLSMQDIEEGRKDLPGFMQKVLTSIQAIPEGLQRDQAAAEYFGKSWVDVVQLMKLTPEVMDAAREKVEKLGLTMGGSSAATIKKYRDAMNDVGDTLQLIKGQVAVSLMPTLTALGDWFNETGPAVIGSFTSTLKVMLDILSNTAVQVTLVALVFRTYFYESVMSAGKAALAFAQTMRLQVALGMMEGASSAKAFTTALLGKINAFTVFIALAGATIWLFDKVGNAEKKAAEEAEKASKAERERQASVTQGLITDAQRVVQLEESYKKYAGTASDAIAAKQHLAAATEDLISKYPELNNYLKDEEGRVKTIAEGYKDMASAKLAEAQATKTIMELNLLDAKKGILDIDAANKKESSYANPHYASITFNEQRKVRLQAFVKEAEASLQQMTANVNIWSSILAPPKTFEAPKSVTEQFSRAFSEQVAAKQIKEGTVTAQEKLNIAQALYNKLVGGADEKERASIQQQITQLKVQANSEDRSLRVNAINRRIAELKETETGFLDVLRQKDIFKNTIVPKFDGPIAELKKLQQTYKENTTEYQNTANQIVDIERAKAKHLAEIEVVSLKEQHEARLSYIDEETSASIQEANYFGASRGEILQIELDSIDKRRKEIASYYEDLVIIYELDADKLLEITRARDKALEDLDNQRKSKKQDKTTEDKFNSEETTVSGGLGSYLKDTYAELTSFGTMVKGLAETIENSLGNAFENIFKRGMTGAQKWKSLWSSVSGAVVGAIGKIIAKELMLLGVEKIRIAWLAISEGVTWKEAAAQIAASNAKVAQNSVETASNTAKATSGFFAAHSWIPWVGAAIALGFIAVMLATMSKNNKVSGRAKGGLVTSPELTLLGEGGQSEIVAPKDDFLDYTRDMALMGASIMSGVKNDRRLTTGFTEYDNNLAQSYANSGVSAQAPIVNIEYAITDKVDKRWLDNIVEQSVKRIKNK